MDVIFRWDNLSFFFFFSFRTVGCTVFFFLVGVWGFEGLGGNKLGCIRKRCVMLELIAVFSFCRVLVELARDFFLVFYRRVNKYMCAVAMSARFTNTVLSR